MNETTTTNTQLSPAAQAVLDALYMDELNGPQQLMARAHAAAVLRAAADSIIPAKGGSELSMVRDSFHAIAFELETHQ
jgi:hypothetical protein